MLQQDKNVLNDYLQAQMHMGGAENVDVDEIAVQVRFLEREIGKALGEYRIISEEVSCIENDLAEFLNEYNKSVGLLCEEVRVVNSILKVDGIAAAATATDMWEDELDFSYVGDAEDQVKDNEVRHLYRRLAKMFHPDMTNNDECAADMFKELSESYQKNDLQTMVMIEQTFFGEFDIKNETMVQKLERLEKQLDKILNDLDKTKLTKFDVQNSEEYKLQQRVKWSAMCGDDLIGTIKDKIQRELTAKKAVLQLAKD